MPGRAAQRNDFLLGVNYWPRHTAMAWWKRFDVGEVDDEFAQIAEWGLHLVRFCLLWEDFQPRPDTVDRVRLGNLQTVLDLAWKYGLRTVPTLLVGNMSGIMWMPCWAFTDRPEEGTILQMCEGRYVRLQLRSPFDDPGMLRAEALLAREAAAAIGGHPALHSWDLANEIDQAYLPAGPDSGWLWAWCVSQALRAGSSPVAVTYGAHALSLTTRGLTIPALAPTLDYLSMHGYPIYSPEARGPLDPDWVPFVTALTSVLGGKPCMMQEFGLCTAPPGEPSHTIQVESLGAVRPQFMASEEDAAAYYRAVLERLWRGGAMGALAWNYSDYPRDLWTEPPLDSALHERTFGVFRADGSPKPAVRVLRQFSRELSNGTLAKRLGPHGVAAVRLEVDPAEYYRDPASSLRRLYRRYLDALEAAGA